MAVLVLLNNFLHDFSAAGWLFCTVILWSMLRKEILNRNSERFFIEMLETILALMRFSLGGIIIFGIFRALAYKTYEWSSSAGQSQVTLLIVKHFILLGIFGVGVFFYIRARKIIKKVNINNGD